MTEYFGAVDGLAFVVPSLLRILIKCHLYESVVVLSKSSGVRIVSVSSRERVIIEISVLNFLNQVLVLSLNKYVVRSIQPIRLRSHRCDCIFLILCSHFRLLLSLLSDD